MLMSAKTHFKKSFSLVQTQTARMVIKKKKEKKTNVDEDVEKGEP